MKIAGIKTNSFVDYDDNIAYVVFTAGCNMNCWYCHNRHILSSGVELLEESEIITDIKEHIPFIDAVVISGGEPTLQKDLKDFIKKLKNLDIKIKLDTNGTNPQVVKELLDENLLDYVAMDIKTSFGKYKNVTLVNDDIQAIKQTIHILMNSSIDYEFRTTVAPNVSEVDLLSIARYIRGANKYVLQQYVPHKEQIRDYGNAHEVQYLEKIVNLCCKYVKTLLKS